jgi:P27 family predicted phage terminase small subunit
MVTGPRRAVAFFGARLASIQKSRQTSEDAIRCSAGARNSVRGCGKVVAMKTPLPPPPSHLSASSAAWWMATCERYVLEEHHLRLLQLCCEAWDRAQDARQRLHEDGLTVTGQYGVKPHPAVAIERDSRLTVARLVRELDLDVEPPASDRVALPPLLSNNRMTRHARKVAHS